MAMPQSGEEDGAQRTASGGVVTLARVAFGEIQCSVQGLPPKVMDRPAGKGAVGDARRRREVAPESVTEKGAAGEKVKGVAARASAAAASAAESAGRQAPSAGEA